MAILVSTGCEVYVNPCPHDKDEKKYYFFVYRPPIWEANMEYIKGTHRVLASSATGFMHTCKSSGVSGSVEPNFATVENTNTEDGTVLWNAQAYDALLRTNDTIVSSIWQTDSVDTVIDSPIFSGGYMTGFRLVSVPVGAVSVTITNLTTILREDGTTWDYNRSIEIPIKEL